MLIIADAADERASTYQALSRSAVNAGYTLGAGISAIGLAAGTGLAYRILIGVNALPFLIAAGLVLLTRGHFGDGRVATRSHRATSQAASATATPWRNRDYVLFSFMDTAMNLDDSVSQGLPATVLLGHTAAPHALVPTFLLINTILIFISRVGVSAQNRRSSPACKGHGILWNRNVLCCTIIATCDRALDWVTSAGLLIAATLTMAEPTRSVSSWKLAMALASPEARASHLGTASMTPSIQKSIGPSFMTGAVLAFGPAGWLALGMALACPPVAQSRFCLRRLNRLSL
ncbi:hypothetical protein [Actinomadura nitritigenes]|uniref:hypothetical protein n=1 Tax=Actinomadura nitritigenes TaxID=134602 RepID=UPI003D8ED5B9